MLSVVEIEGSSTDLTAALISRFVDRAKAEHDGVSRAAERFTCVGFKDRVRPYLRYPTGCTVHGQRLVCLEQAVRGSEGPRDVEIGPSASIRTRVPTFPGPFMLPSCSVHLSLQIMLLACLGKWTCRTKQTPRPHVRRCPILSRTVHLACSHVPTRPRHRSFGDV